MKKALSLLLSLVMVITALPLTSMVSFAQEEICKSGDWYYRVLDDGTAEIYKSSYKSAYSGNETNVTIPSKIDGYTVTSIGNYAFYNCKSLTSITIPDSVTSIGNDAFNGCSLLTIVTIPDSVTGIGYRAFWYCTSIKSITIPDNVICIGDRTFYHCTSLASIAIPNSVTSIEGGAFEDCTSLESINIPANITSIGNGAFSGCSLLKSISVDKNNPKYICINGILFNKDKTELLCYPSGKADKTYNVPESVISIEDYAFNGCDSLKSVVIPNSVKNIGVRAFINCALLESINIPDSVTSIGSYAFNYCESLTSITIPNSVISIGSSTFENCTSLASITIPNSVTSIGGSAFKNCTSLESIYVNEENKNYSSENGVLFNKYKTELICYPAGKTNSTYIVPNGVTSIEHSAFENCTSLKSVTIPNGVESIGSSAFSYCMSLESININEENKNYRSKDGILFNKAKTELICYPAGKTSSNYTILDSVTSIGYSAFCGCSSLESVTIPDGVKSIGGSAFNGCASLESISISDSVTNIGSNAFIDTAYYNNSENWEDGVLYIGHHLIRANSDELSSNYKIKDGTLTVSGNAFYQCISLKNVIIPDSVISISDGGLIIGAFSMCLNLESVAFGGSLKHIGMAAFAVCVTLESVILPEGLETIDVLTFLGCLSLKSITIPKSVTSIAKSAISVYESNEDLIIYGYEGTEAERYAKENNINFLVPENNDPVVEPTPNPNPDNPTPDDPTPNPDTPAPDEPTPEAPADLNGDNKTTVVDAKWTLQAVAGSRALTAEQKAAADVNGDGKVTVVDAKWILQAVAGMRDLSKK